ncbi:MFS transporter [Piscinibacter sp.]|uniref:MFS transporter n=1 Tax=Piscinibacter sp. TaxID=1903157 RepID=UPI0039E249A2
MNGAKRATRLAIFIGGFGLACWAPMVPFAAQRLQADSATLGSILLCLGLGALIGMFAAGAGVARKGLRVTVVAGALGVVVALPMLALTMAHAYLLAASLLLLGAACGVVDVAANIHGIEVQDAAGVPLMSGFHGLYSIGGLVGTAGMTLAIGMGVSITTAAFVASAVMLAAIVAAASGFLPTRKAAEATGFVMPRGIVVVIGLLLFTIFLVEGAVLDWGAILLSDFKGVDVSRAGIGYTVFSLATTVSRLSGDWLVARLGSRALLLHGVVMAGGGLAVAALVASPAVALLGIAVAGLAAGNVAPILVTAAGRQKVMPASDAVAATSMVAYLGVLLGPALIGYASHFIGLPATLLALGVLTAASVVAVPAVVARTGP